MLLPRTLDIGHFTSQQKILTWVFAARFRVRPPTMGWSHAGSDLAKPAREQLSNQVPMPPIILNVTHHNSQRGWLLLHMAHRSLIKMKHPDLIGLGEGLLLLGSPDGYELLRLRLCSRSILCGIFWLLRRSPKQSEVPGKRTSSRSTYKANIRNQSTLSPVTKLCSAAVRDGTP